MEEDGAAAGPCCGPVLAPAEGCPGGKSIRAPTGCQARFGTVKLGSQGMPFPGGEVPLPGAAQRGRGTARSARKGGAILPHHGPGWELS